MTATSAVSNADSKTVTASCSGGRTAIGGGATIVDGTAGAQLVKVAIAASAPTAGLGGWTATAWETTAINPANGTWSLTITVLCATVT